MVTNDQKQRYRDIIAQANDDQTIIDAIYAGAVKQLAEMNVMAKLEGDRNNIITDLIILSEIIEMTSEVFEKTSDQVNADMLLATEMLPIDDIEAAHQLKQNGMLN